MNRKTVFAGALAALLVLSLGGCTTPVTAPTDTSVTTVADETEATTTTTAAPVKNDAARAAFAKALESVRTQHMFPDGTSCKQSDDYDVSQNTFAVSDVDGDGQEELVLLYSETYTAGMVGYVFGYDTATATLKTELKATCLLTFLENGAVRADWLHNPGVAGDFWPYNLYRYNAQTDLYEMVGAVDAWSKEFAPKNAAGAAFPDEVDTEHAGIVYYLLASADSPYPAPVSSAAYDQWLHSVGVDNSEQALSPANLTADNIAALTKK